MEARGEQHYWIASGSLNSTIVRVARPLSAWFHDEAVAKCVKRLLELSI